MTTLGSPQVRRGLRLLVRTLLTYRRASMLSILSALWWMVLVVASPYVLKIVIDRAVAGERRDLLVPLVGLLLIAGLLKAAGVGGRRYYAFQLSYRAETDLRNRIFEHSQRLAFAFHDQVPAGELMSRASSDLGQVRLIFAMLPITVANLVMFVAVITVMVVIDPLLGAVTALAVPGLLVLANRYARRVLKVSWEVQQRIADLTSVVEESVAGVRVVKAYGQEEREVAKLADRADDIYQRVMYMLRFRSIYVPMFELVPAAAMVAVLWIGGMRVIDGALTLGEFVAFTDYLVILAFPLRLTGWFFAELPRSAAAAARVVDLLRTAPDIATDPHARPLPAGPGEVWFHDVQFAYPEGPPVLRGLDLHVPGGSSLAVVGSTGSGKTTLAYLIPRFYDVDGGAVTLDGVDVRHLDVEELRDEVALVFEDTFLFSASVRDNIAFGAPEATVEQVRLAARLARAHEFIEALPSGYETVVGERGFSLSGGQRQRIALARAVLRDPRVLILDDATSSVDAITEDEIRTALRTVMEGRTTIIIAHRSSTLSLADRVALIDDGRVVAIGPHRDLLASVPRYRQVLDETLAGDRR